MKNILIDLGPTPTPLEVVTAFEIGSVLASSLEELGGGLEIQFLCRFKARLGGSWALVLSTDFGDDMDAKSTAAWHSNVNRLKLPLTTTNAYDSCCVKPALDFDELQGLSSSQVLDEVMRIVTGGAHRGGANYGKLAARVDASTIKQALSF